MNRWQHGIAWLILASLVTLFCHQLAFSDLILARGDTYNYFYPYWDVRNEALRSGQLPLWTSDIFMGAPLLANPQLGTFYPPNWLTIPFAAPDAVRLSILAHLVWAAWGVFTLYCAAVDDNWQAAFLASVVFALSGYAGAHAEQINQLQGLSWLPWLLYLFHKALHSHRHWQWSIGLAIAFALQFFSGHTQTVFMSGIALGLMALLSHTTPLAIGRALLRLAGIALVAALLALPQLLPTLELTGMSSRGGGFNAQEATAFSLPPTYLGHALLPNYEGLLFTEYLGYVGIFALGLAMIGATQPLAKHRRRRWLWFSMASLGLLLALGRFNPLYWWLAELPGFNFFRVPARWLLLWTMGVSVLSGMGWQALLQQRVHWRVILAVIALFSGLMALGRLLAVDPVDIVGPASATNTALLIWALSLVVFVSIWLLSSRLPRRFARILGSGLIVLIIIELFAASQILPYNDLAPRSVYQEQRFTISQLLAYEGEQIAAGRGLSISDLRFDVGDRVRLRERWATLGLGEESMQTAFTAVKRQEIIAPNLPLTWGIPSIDGYGGGVLPTIYYSQFTSLMLPEGNLRTVDGRLGEMLASPECRGVCLPALQRLRDTDTRYLITDKIYDVVHEGIRYDTAFAQSIETETQLYLPETIDFAHDTVHLLYTASEAPHLLADRSDVRVAIQPTAIIELPEDLAIAQFEIAETYLQISISPQSANTSLLATTLVDSRTSSFVEMPRPPFERVLSSDIKLYRYPDSSRVQIITSLDEAAIFPDDWDGHEAAVAALAQGTAFTLNTPIPVEELILQPAQTASENSATIVEYTSTRVVIEAETSLDSYIYLADAHYPGWQAQVNGNDAPIYRANVMFRAVPVPAGNHTIVFEFIPILWNAAFGIGGGLWLLIFALWGILWRRTAEEPSGSS